MKDKLKKLWRFIWEDNSIWSWLVNLILAFVLVKFIIYPGLGLLLGTGYPVVAVVSGSMEHDGGFDNWWSSQENIYNELGITKNEFKDFRFKNGFNKGDIMVLIGSEKINIGDVIVFRGGASEPIIHRVVKIDSLQTKGDQNTGSRNDEIGISKDRIIGKAVIRVPYLGWVKLIFVGVIDLIR